MSNNEPRKRRTIQLSMTPHWKVSRITLSHGVVKSTSSHSMYLSIVLLKPVHGNERLRAPGVRADVFEFGTCPGVFAVDTGII